LITIIEMDLTVEQFWYFRNFITELGRKFDMVCEVDDLQEKCPLIL
jgi:hypothetical protein